MNCRLLSIMLPKGNRLPTSRDIVRHYVTSLGGLDYDRIHACVNDCILFRGMHKEARHCPTCGEARYTLMHTMRARAAEAHQEDNAFKELEAVATTSSKNYKDDGTYQTYRDAHADVTEREREFLKTLVHF